MGFDDATGAPGDDQPPADTMRTVTVQLGGSANGTVVGPNGFMCTQGTCTLEVEPGTTVSLRGLAATDGWFDGWTGPCGGNFNCALEVNDSVTVSADFAPTPNRVFVTSTTTAGAFGGIAGGDQICRDRAVAGGLTGTFIAYLSDGATDAASRVSSSRGWVRVDGAPYADMPAAFSTGALVFPARLDELGNDLGQIRIYTGTDHGNKTIENCLGWTSAVGTDTGTITEGNRVSDSIGGWGSACSDAAHLLCVETGRSVPVATHADTGKLAFMTHDEWYPGGGLASADAYCASQAATASLPGTFLAALATTTQSIASRFDNDAIYRRTDGVRLLRDAGLFSSDWIDTAPEHDQAGVAISNDFWTGSQKLTDVAPDGGQNCNDWTDATMLLSGPQHWTTNTDMRSQAKTEPCTDGAPILCLEQ
jgi:hypothetical protein